MNRYALHTYVHTVSSGKTRCVFSGPADRPRLHGIVRNRSCGFVAVSSGNSLDTFSLVADVVTVVGIPSLWYANRQLWKQYRESLKPKIASENCLEFLAPGQSNKPRSRLRASQSCPELGKWSIYQRKEEQNLKSALIVLKDWITCLCDLSDRAANTGRSSQGRCSCQ